MPKMVEVKVIMYKCDKCGKQYALYEGAQHCEQDHIAEELRAMGWKGNK